MVDAPGPCKPVLSAIQTTDGCSSKTATHNKFRITRGSTALRSKISLDNPPPAGCSATPNIQDRFPAVVLDLEAGNENLGVRTVLDNLSARDFSLHLAHPVKEGKRLLVITQLSQAIVLLRGEVTRVQQDETGGYRLSMSITQHQIFSSLAAEPPL